MNIYEIKQAVDAGKKVFWASRKYQVIKEDNGEYKIKYTWNEKTTELIKKDGVTLTCNSNQFFIES